MSWNPNWAYVGLLLGPLPFILIALLMQKRLTITISICDAHRRKRRRAMWIAWLTVFVGFAILFYGVLGSRKGSAVVILIGVVVILAALVFGIIRTRIVWPRRITKDRAWVKGCCREFLASYPEYLG
jgi:hypothetical protein